MNRARLRELGFDLGACADTGESDEGAWFATAPDGTPVVLKWFPDGAQQILPGASVRNPSPVMVERVIERVLDRYAA